MIDSNLRTLVRCCRDYFPEGSTQEMLDEWRPMMGYGKAMIRAMNYLELFLPTFNCFHRKDSTYRLWFEEIMTFWQGSHLPRWSVSIYNLMARLAENNQGSIDWNPYIPQMFTKIQLSFNLPVTYKDTMDNMYNCHVSSYCRWIVATLGKNSQTQDYLDQMFKVFQSYLNPANATRAISDVSTFVLKLCKTFVTRVYRERHAKACWWKLAESDDCKLNEKDIDRFVESVLPLPLSSMYARRFFQDAAATFKQLASLRPDWVLPKIIENFYASLDTLTEPHKLTSTMAACSSVARMIVDPGSRYPEARTHVIPMLMAVLPGIDRNDIPKTFSTYRFIVAFCSLVPLVDSTKSLQIHSDSLTEIEREICCQSAQFEDFVLQFLDKCFAMVESSSFTSTRQETGTQDQAQSSEDISNLRLLCEAFFVIIIQSSEEIFDAALRKVKHFMDGKILETQVSGPLIAVICAEFCNINFKKAGAAFLPNALRILRETDENVIKTQSTLDNEFKFNLLMIEKVNNHLILTASLP